MRSFLLTGLFIMFCLPATAQDQRESLEQTHPSVELPEELDRVLRDYEKHWSESQPARVAALFTEDGFALPSSRPPFRGREAITGAYKNAGGNLILRALAYETEGSIGYIIGAYRYIEDGLDSGKFVLALRQDETGKWMIAADIDNGIRRDGG